MKSSVVLCMCFSMLGIWHQALASPLYGLHIRTCAWLLAQCTPVVWSLQHAVLVTHATKTCQDPQLQNPVLVQCLEHATLAPAMPFMQIPLTCGPHVCSWRQEECIVHCLNCILRPQKFDFCHFKAPNRCRIERRSNLQVGSSQNSF